MFMDSMMEHGPAEEVMLDRSIDARSARVACECFIGFARLVTESNFQAE